MTRTPEEVFHHHVQALGAEDLDEIVADHADDAVFITPAGIRRGKDGIRAAFSELLADVPQATWERTVRYTVHTHSTEVPPKQIGRRV